MRVAVVGAGAIGLACAYSLARRDADVVVVERGAAGEGCSFGNTGWICPALSAPLPAPKVMRRAVLGMLRRDSPLLVQPRLDRAFVGWSWQFWRACAPERYRVGLEATVALNRQTFDLFDDLRASGVRFALHKTGMVVAARSESGLEEYVEMIEGAQRAGYAGPVEVVEGEALRRHEPALDESVVGGLLVPDERYVRPEELTSALADFLRARGVEVREQTEVERLERRNGGWWLATAGEPIRADRVVVAAGAWSARLLAPLGVKTPFEAAKGYSVTARGVGTTPSHALYLAEAKVGASSFGESVRFAGIFDLTGIDSTLRRRRIEAILRSALPYLRDWRPETIELEWAGLRPYPADGLPIVGAVPRQAGVYAATGHGRLGITLAPVTGEGVADLVLDGTAPRELRPFGFERFAR